jgi:DNA-directed RNA polymerase subunit RPC12/RpoP
MDTDTLVDKQIADGRRLAAQLVKDGLDVTAIAWLKASEDGRWLLYIASKAVDEKGPASVYRAVHAALQRLPDSLVSFSEVKLIGADNPITKDILEIQRGQTGKIATRFRELQLGGMAVDEAYIYLAQCANCKMALPDDSDLSDDKRTPCPRCGSKGRIRSVETTDGIGLSSITDVVLITYPQSLLNLAKIFIDQGHFSIALIVAHMACEIASERAISAAFAARGISDLEEPVESFLNGYNLGNPRIRQLYTALTRDEIEKNPFWEEFQVSGDRRNAVIHRGATVDKTTAEKSLKAATDLVAHLMNR